MKNKSIPAGSSPGSLRSAQQQAFIGMAAHRMPQRDSLLTQLEHSAREARRWLFGAALPLWWMQGASARGGFHEKLGLDGLPVGVPARLRVQARQVYAYAEAGKLGWQGPWSRAMHHGLHFMLSRYRRDDGLFRSTLDTADQRIDLYDQAFVLLALAKAYEADQRPPELLRTARALLGRLDAQLKHPFAGYEEAQPRQLPLRSNPHMHLLEAMLAWVAIGVMEPFAGKAHELTALAMTRFIDHRATLSEYFDGNWSPLPLDNGNAREPGHHFEWAYLLSQSAALLDIDTRAACKTLEAFASRHGVDCTRQVVVFALDDRGQTVDSRARLWAQTERLRACLHLGQQTENAFESDRLYHSALQSYATLRRYLDTPIQGLWHEWMDAQGQFIQEPSPASSLYHLVSAISGLCLWEQARRQRSAASMSRSVLY